MSAADIRALFEARRALIAAPIPFTIPGFGPVFVKILDAKTAAKNAALLQDAGERSLMLQAALSVCDETGVPVFDIGNEDDMALIEGMDPKTLQAIWVKSQFENAQNEAGAEAAGNALPLAKSS